MIFAPFPDHAWRYEVLDCAIDQPGAAGSAAALHARERQWNTGVEQPEQERLVTSHPHVNARRCPAHEMPRHALAP